MQGNSHARLKKNFFIHTSKSPINLLDNLIKIQTKYKYLGRGEDVIYMKATLKILTPACVYKCTHIRKHIFR